MTVAATVSFAGVGRTFAQGRNVVRALDGVDLELAAGSFTAIVGPSGCGKSTLLTIAAGLDTAFDGTVEITPRDAHVAYLFQRPRLFPWLTARRNVSFVLETRGTSRAVARERAEECLQLVGLAGAGDRFPLHLSGGMQQRVALARSLAVQPALLLMDEPFSSLDELTAQRLRDEIAALATRSGCTVLLVTHNIAEASFLADRVVAMTKGPGRIIDAVDVDSPRPRDSQDPSLLDTARHVATSLRRADQPPTRARAAHLTTTTGRAPT